MQTAIARRTSDTHNGLAHTSPVLYTEGEAPARAHSSAPALVVIESCATATPVRRGRYADFNGSNRLDLLPWFQRAQDLGETFDDGVMVAAHNLALTVFASSCHDDSRALVDWTTIL